MSAVSQTSGRRAAGDVAMQVVTRALNLALGVVVTALVVRTLGESGYGQWSTILVAVQLASYFTTFGLEGVVVRQAAAEPEREAEWVGALVVLRLALSIPGILIGLAILLLTQESDAMLVAGLILLLQFPLGAGISMQAVHQLRVRNRWPMFVLTVNSVVWAVAVLVIHLRDGGLVAFAIALTGAYALTAALQVAGALRIGRLELRPQRATMAELLRIGVPVGISGLLIIAYARIDQVLVFELAGSRDAGSYGVAYRMLEAAFFIPTSVMVTLGPILASAWTQDRVRLQRIIRQAAEVLTVASLGVLAFTMVAAEPVLRLLFGAGFESAAPALRVLAGSFVFICFGYLLGNLLLVTKLQNRMVLVGGVALAVNVVGNLLLVPSGGFMAAAWMTLVTEALVVALSARLVWSRLGTGVPSPGRLPQIVLAAAALGVVLALLDAAGLPLGALTLAAAAAYPALLLVLRAVDPAELRALLARRAA